MVNYISGLVFTVLFLIGAAVVVPFAPAHPVVATIVGIVWLVADLILASAIRIAAQWERAVVFRLGKYKEIKGPGLFLIIPLIDQIRMVDTRILAVHIPKQQVITRDNVPVIIDAALFFRVINAADAIIMVQDYRNIILQFAQTSLRDVIGQGSLDQLLTEREQIAKSIQAHVENDTKGWGLEVTGLRIQDVDMPEELQEDDVAAGLGRAAKSEPRSPRPRATRRRRSTWPRRRGRWARALAPCNCGRSRLSTDSARTHRTRSCSPCLSK